MSRTDKQQGAKAGNSAAPREQLEADVAQLKQQQAAKAGDAAAPREQLEADVAH
jgi:hypothetical protein